VLARHVSVYVSSNDRALLMSGWVNRKRPLGRTAEIAAPPEARTEQYQFQEALELLDLQAKGLRNLAVVDATPINRTRNLHHFFTDSPEVFDDLYRELLEPDNPVSRRFHPTRTEQGVNYWMQPRTTPGTPRRRAGSMRRPGPRSSIPSDRPRPIGRGVTIGRLVGGPASRSAGCTICFARRSDEPALQVRCRSAARPLDEALELLVRERAILTSPSKSLSRAHLVRVL